MKNILLLVHADAGQEARLQAALDLTRALEGHLTCLDVIQLPVLGGDYVSVSGQAILLEDEQAREAENRRRLEERLLEEDVPWDMLRATGDIAECVSKAAGLADLIVVNRQLDTFSPINMRAIATSVAVKSRKPLVAVSDSCRSFAVDRALVAWDGSEPAMAAVRAATPLLRLATYVQVFEVTDGRRRSLAEEAAAYLSRHDVHPVVRVLRDEVRDPAELIREACKECAATYCVMGAFGHSPMKEAIFGGVTRRMLSSSDVPLFLAH